jgi:peptide/nickel transport system permease protein
MIRYVARRVAYGAVTILGVLLFLFILFFMLATPDDVARKAVGEKAPAAVLEQWKKNHGYDKPRFWNAEHPLDSMLVEHFRRMLTFDFGRSDADDTPISARLRRGVGPSLYLTVPLFAIGLVLSVLLSLFITHLRGTYVDRASVVLCVLSMSLSILVYIIGVQYLIGKLLRWFPISGFDPSPSVVFRFLALPLIVGVMAELGSDVRFFRTVFLEETGKEYVRTALAKGCSPARVMLRHVLRNALIPILTQVVIAIPFLFTGSLLLESFFGIPGLGSMTVEAINGNDFATLRTMVYIGALMFVGAQILTDVCYTLADPRVRLE